MLMKYRLFTPGPTSVPEATLIELAKPVHHHRTGEFRAMFNEVQASLKYVYQTASTVYTITGSGTAVAIELPLADPDPPATATSHPAAPAPADPATIATDLPVERPRRVRTISRSTYLSRST